MKMACRSSTTSELEYIYISEPDDNLKCCICLEVASNPKQEEGCGKLFCSDCIEGWGEDTCPHCRASPLYFSDKKSLREIKSLGVRCSNVERGCGWEGRVETLEDHVIKCGFIFVPCPNRCKKDNGEIVQVLKKSLESHLDCCPEREYQCLDCGLKGIYRVIVGQHDVECEKKIVVCPNEECCVSLERAMVKEHVQKFCKYSVCQCRYAKIGCEARVSQENLERHENDMEYHFKMAMDRISELMDKISNPPPSPPPPPQPLPPPPPPQNNAKVLPPMTFRLCDYYGKKRSNVCHYFQPFFSYAIHGYMLNLYVYANGKSPAKNKYLSVYIKVLEGPFDFQLDWPLEGSFTIELLNQLEDSDHYGHTLRFTKEDRCHPGSSGWGFSKFIKQSYLHHNPAKNTQYLKDNMLFFRVTSNPASSRPWLNFAIE